MGSVPSDGLALGLPGQLQFEAPFPGIFGTVRPCRFLIKYNQQLH